MLLPVHHHAVMHLVGQNHEAVAAGNLHNLLQDLFRIEGRPTEFAGDALGGEVVTADNTENQQNVLK